MLLPPSEMFSIADAASRWNTSNRTIEEYLLTEKLQSSVYLPQIILLKYTRQFNYECNYDDVDPYCFDIDYEDPESFQSRQGLFNLSYQNIKWDEIGQATLEKGEMFLSVLDEEALFGFNEPFVLNREEVFITLPEITRFEEEHGISAQKLNEKVNCQESVTNSSSKLHPKEKESLLKMVIAMAIDLYGYDPKQLKSPTPTELVNDIEKLGLAIDVDTVRKWLKEASSLLPGVECEEFAH